jgi:hypothetical protein
MESGVVTADSALRKTPELAVSIEELWERFAYFPGSRQGRLTVGFADARSDSAGESVTRVQFHRYGIPIPDLQHDVFDDRGGLIGTSDFYWEDCRHLGEFDGKIKYLSCCRRHLHARWISRTGSTYEVARSSPDVALHALLSRCTCCNVCIVTGVHVHVSSCADPQSSCAER